MPYQSIIVDVMVQICLLCVVGQRSRTHVRYTFVEHMYACVFHCLLTLLLGEIIFFFIERAPTQITEKVAMNEPGITPWALLANSCQFVIALCFDWRK
jgi:hypothetical protein